jgi:hypothetical protein
VSGTNLTLHLVKPEAADPRVRRIYDDTRRTLHLPWIGALFQAYALYPDYLEMAWNELLPALGIRQFAADATAIGNAADQAVARFYTPSYSGRDVAAMNLNSRPFARPSTLSTQATLNCCWWPRRCSAPSRRGPSAAVPGC